MPEDEPLQLAGYNSNVSLTPEDQVSFVIPFNGLATTDYSDFQAGLGFISYSNNTDDGFVMFAGGKFNFEAICKPNSNELELLDYGADNFNQNNFKILTKGGLTSDADKKPNSIYISNALLNQNLDTDKFIIFRFWFNCKSYLGWLKISIEDDGTLSNFQTVFNTDENGDIFVGQFQETCLPHVDRSDLFYIQKFSVRQNGTDVYDNDQGTGNSGSTTYSDYTSDLITVDLGVGNYSLFIRTTLDVNTFDGLPHEGFWYVWVDYNRNNRYEETEVLYYKEEAVNVNNVITIPTELSGIYNMRVVTSYRKLASLNGCSKFYNSSDVIGEVEDYRIEFISACPSDLTITDEIPQGDRKVNNRIFINTDAKLKFNEVSDLQAGKCILMEANTLIEYGSVFFAHIDECEGTSPKQLQPQLPTSTVKVYPNPFSQQSTVEFELYNNSEVSIFVSDITGKKLATLANAEQKSSGVHQVTFNAKGIAPGIYYCTLINGDQIETQKMVITK